MKKILVCHYHKNFPVNEHSDWIIPTIYERNKFISKKQICLQDYEKNIATAIPYLSQFSEERIGYLSQTVAAEYWVSQYCGEYDYVSVTGYRRLPLYEPNFTLFNKNFDIPQNKNNYEIITRNKNWTSIDSILKLYDLIQPYPMVLKKNIADEFIDSQRIEIWKLFIDQIKLLPEPFSNLYEWFYVSNSISFSGPAGFIKFNQFNLYQKYLIKIINGIIDNSKDPFKLVNSCARFRTDRWIGYIAERFYQYFVFCLKFHAFYVPLCYLEENRWQVFRGVKLNKSLS